jgi:hypothetical protein
MYVSKEWREYELWEIIRQHEETSRARQQRVEERIKNGERVNWCEWFGVDDVHKSRHISGNTSTFILMLQTAHVRKALLIGCSSIGGVMASVQGFIKLFDS